MIRVLVLLLWAGPVWAVLPAEMLTDPGLEARAREISQGLRCPVCRNESIDESGATVAADLRLLVRERLVASDTDRQVVAFVVARYGEFVLLNPRLAGGNWVLWLAGPGLLALGGLAGWAAIRRAGAGVDVGLTADESRRLSEVLQDKA